MVHTSRGEVEEAQKRYLKLHEAYPEDPIYAYKVGTTYKLLKQYQPAYDHLKKADVENFKFRDQVYLQLGDVCLELKEFKEAEEYFKKAGELNPRLKAASSGKDDTRVATLMAKGNQAFKEKKYDEALKLYSEAKAKSPNSAGPYLLAGSTLIVMERYDDARKELNKAIDLNPKNPRGYSLLGSSYYKQKRYREALKVFDSGLKIAPESYEMHNKVGLVYRDQEEYRRAIESFDRAVKIRKEYVPARINLAFAYLDDKRYPEADREFKEAARLAPTNTDLQKGQSLVKIYTALDRGDRFLQDGRSKQANREYRKILKMKGGEAIGYEAMGRAEFAARRYNPSIRYFNRSLKKDPNNIAAIQGLLRVYGVKKDRRRQRTLLARLRKLTRNDLTAAVALGRLKEDQGQLKEAERIYLDLLKTKKDNDILKRRLGYVYYKRGLESNRRERYKEARNWFAKAEKFNPDIPQLPETKQIVEENIKFGFLLPTIKRAEAYYSRTEYARALPLYEKAYGKLKRPLLLVKIAFCHIQMGNEQKGLDLLKNARQAPRADISISEALYTYFMKKGEMDVAEKGFKGIISEHPGANYSLYKLGIIEITRENYDEAIEYLNRSLIYDPEFSVAYIARGVAFYKSGDSEQAGKEFQVAKNRNGHSALASFNQGVILYNDNLLDKAEGIFQSIVKKHPSYVDAYYQLSYIYFSRGDTRRAESYLGRAMKVDPNNPRYQYALSQVYEKNFQKSRNPVVAAKLKTIYQKIIKDAPSSRYAQESRKKLRTLAPGERVVHPYPLTKKARQTPIFYNGAVYTREDRLLTCVEATEKKIAWKQKYSEKTRGLLVSQYVYVLAGDRVFIYDTVSGAPQGDFKVESGGIELVGAYDRIGVVYKKGRETNLSVYDQNGQKLGENRSSGQVKFLYAGSFYRDNLNGSSHTLHFLGENGARLSQTPALPIKGVTSRSFPRLLRRADNLYLFFPGRGLALVSAAGDLTRVKKLASTQTALYILDEDEDDYKLLLPGRGGIDVLDEDTDKSKAIRLPVALLSPASVFIVNMEKIAYIGVDRHIHMITMEGKELWKKALSRNQGAFSLYY